MTIQTNRPPYVTQYKTPFGDEVTVGANRGVQAFGRTSGSPLDATDPGQGYLLAQGSDGATVEIQLTPGVCSALREILYTAENVMDSRLVENDVPRPKDDA